MKKLKEVINVELFKHQKEGVLFALNHHYSLNGDDMGLGKSIQSIAVALVTESRLVVVCPASLRYNWENELNKFSIRKLKILQFNSKTPYEKVQGDWDVVIIPYSILQKPLVKNCFILADMVIADEVPYVKNLRSARARSFHKLLKETRPLRFMGLSGTIIENRVTEWYSPLLLCSYSSYPSSGYDMTYFFKNQTQFNTYFSLKTQFKVKGRTIIKWHGLKNADRLEKLKKNKYLRRETKDAIDLPSLIRKDVVMRFKHAEEGLKKAWEAPTLTPALATKKADSAYEKAPHTVEYVEDLLEEGHGPIVIFTDHVNSAMRIHLLLSKKYKGTRIDGSISMEGRRDKVAEFQEGKYDFLVCTIGSSATGITLTKGQHLVFNDLNWTPAQNAQAEKRIHRIGQKHKCIIHRIIGSKIDEMIYKNLTAKMEVLTKTL